MFDWQRDDGPLAKRIHRDTENTEEAQRTAEWLIDVFGKGNVYAELQRHFNREEEARNQAVMEIARTVTSAFAGHEWRLSCDAERSAKWPTCSPAFAITCDWKLPGVYWRQIPNAI